MPPGEASRLEAERTIKWCFHIRQIYILKMRKLLKDCKQKVEVSLTRAAECIEVDDRINVCVDNRDIRLLQNHILRIVCTILSPVLNQFF